MRIQIELPKTWLFQTRLVVRVLDINYGRHLGNDRVLGLVHEARVRWLTTLGLSELDIGEGIGLLMADAGLVFQREAYLGDELDIFLGKAKVGRSSFDLVFCLVRAQDNAEIARIKTGMVCFDYKARKISRIPGNFLAHLHLDA